MRGLIFKVNPKLENVHCKLRENLPSSSLNATFGQRLFQPKHILQKDVHVFSQWSLHPSGYNNFFHRFIPHTIDHNQSINHKLLRNSLLHLYSRANVILKCNSSLHCHKNGCSENNMTCKLKLQRKGNRLFLPKRIKTPWRHTTLVRVQIDLALTCIVWTTATRRGAYGGDDT